MLADYLEEKSDLRYKIDLIVPVPTSSDRLRRRGYSIPVLIGTSISQRFRIPLSNNALKLTRDTQDTRGLSAQNKQRILQGAFTVDKPEMVKGLRILLIDDIMTTGTTLLCSVKALRLCNPQNVFAAVLAHTEHSWTWEDS
jgi:predicted amidophosphoribosyltransferase